MSEKIDRRQIVLYADDDPDDIDFVVESFSAHAPLLEVITFPDATDLLSFLKGDQLQNELPCLIILDINMPLLSGKDALKIIRSWSQFDQVPVVIFSTSTSPIDHNFGSAYNAGFISKPLSSRQMDVVVKNFLDHCKEDIRVK
jgi:CheY-like chemotaxis protein